MSIENWSDKIALVELADDPAFSDEVNALTEQYEAHPTDVVLNFQAVGFMNSSNISRLLRLRKLVTTHHHRLVLCSLTTQVGSVLTVTGLDKVFDTVKDVFTALATLQISDGDKGKHSPHKT